MLQNVTSNNLGRLHGDHYRGRRTRLNSWPTQIIVWPLHRACFDGGKKF